MPENYQLLDVRTLHQNADNPRSIDDEMFRKLRCSILLFDKMLRLRPLVQKNLEVLGGNMRLKSLHWIVSATREEMMNLLHGIDAWDHKIDDEKKALLEYWENWQRQPMVPTLDANDFTDKEVEEFIAKDNISYGRWCNRILKKWNQKSLDDWGVAVKKAKEGKNVAEVPFTEVLNESHNYVVLYFDNQVDWLQAKTLLGIKPARCLSTKNGENNINANKVGEGRVLRGAEAINRLLNAKKRGGKK